MNGTKVALGPIPVSSDVALPATIIVPVALLARDMVDNTVVVGLKVGLVAVAAADVLSVSANAVAVLLAMVLAPTGVGLIGPVTVVGIVVWATGTCVVVDIETPPGAQVTPPRYSMNDDSASKT